MSLQFVLGSSGSGKSYRTFREIAMESVKEPNSNFIIIVPEQFTLQTQKDIVRIHPNGGILNIDILSFMRLAYRVFDEIGHKTHIVLEDTGKNMILRKVMEENKLNLKLFRGNLRRQGFVSEIKSLVSELCQYGVGIQDLEELKDKVSENRQLQLKIIEVQKVFQAFKEYMEGKYITAEEVLDILYDVMDQSEIIRDCTFCLDGFTGFTPVQYKLIEKMLIYGKNVKVLITIDEKEDLEQPFSEHKLFGMSMGTMDKLRNIAKKTGTPMEDPIIMELVTDVTGTYKVSYRHKDSWALAHLENYIFRYPYQVNNHTQNDIQIIAASTGKKEAEYVVNQIRKLVMEENYRYREIAVISGDIEMYGRYFEQYFEQEQMPYFIDRKKDISDNPFIGMIKAVFDIARSDFSYESVFRYLRSKMTRMPLEQIDLLENYVIALGKKGEKAWRTMWENTYHTREELQMEEINVARAFVHEGLIDLIKGVKKSKTVLDYAVSFYEFFQIHDFSTLLDRKATDFEEKGMFSLAKEYGQVYQYVMELLDKMVDLLGEEKVTFREFTEIFEAGISEVSIGIIPMTLDQIVVGDMERTRLNDIRALFFVGVNDTIVPKDAFKGGILSDMERELLAQKGFELSPTKSQTVFIEQFYLYIGLTKPKNKLYLTFNRLSKDGKPNKESYLIGRIMKLFPKLKIQETMESSRISILEGEEYSEKTLDDILGSQKGEELLIKGIRSHEINQVNEVWKELFSWNMKNESSRNRIQKWIDASFYKNMDSFINKAVAKAIYGQKDKSVSEIEKYAICSYAHFLEYGLKLKERKEFEIRTLDLGNIYHRVFELFSKKLSSLENGWSGVSEEERERLMAESVQEAVSEYENHIFFSSKRNEFMVERIRQTSQKAAWALYRHVKEGEFIPSGFEIRFSSDTNVPSTRQMVSEDIIFGLKGSIDRMDIGVGSDGEEYIKIIDYKSGEKKFDPGLFLEGIQLQLVVYMNVAMDIQNHIHPSKEQIPAGTFYYTVFDPLLEKDQNMARELAELGYGKNEDGEKTISEDLVTYVKEKAFQKYKMNGIYNGNNKIVGKLDKSLVDEHGFFISGAESKIIDAKIKEFNGESPTAMGSALSGDDFVKVMEHANAIIQKCAKGMFCGEIETNPYKRDKETGCDYCGYKSICGFDTSMEGYQYRKISKMSLSEVVEIIKKEEE